MPLVTSRTELNQGSVLAVAGAIWATGTGADIRIHTGLANNLPALAVGEFFEVRDHSLAVNNGLYQVATVNTSTDDYECDKVNGAAPTTSGAEAVTTLGATGASTEKSVFFDTAGLGTYILEQGNVDAAGVEGKAMYSFKMQEWKDDDFVRANASFPMFMIDTDAGKAIMGQNAAGINSGWNWVDVPAFSIRTRKLLRNLGWNEVDTNGVILARHFCSLSVDVVEDPANDTPFYQFGTNTTVDDTVDLTFAGPMNEAVEFFTRLPDGAVNGGTGVAISADGRSLTRSDGGNWRTDGFIVGGQITLRDSEDATMDGTWLLSAVGTGVDGAVTCGRAADSAAGLVFTDGGGGNDQLTLPVGESLVDLGYVVGSKIIITAAEDVGNDGTHVILAISTDERTADVATASFTANADDTTAVIGMFDDALTPDITVNAAVNNDNRVRVGLRVRDGDVNGKTFAESSLVAIGKSVLGNFIFQFPLANATDSKITATDATIDGSLPYTGMSLTIHATAQARAGLVGGSFNFGYIIDGNDGTDVQVFEWIQRQLRKLTDIDADGDTAIGRAIGLLARFNGDTFEVGSGDGGLTFPVNPDGGGSGVFIDNLNATSKNNVVFFDNTGVQRSFPETIAVTADFNQTAIDDTLAEFDVKYDRTIRTSVTDLVIGTAGGGQITSAGANLPNNAELGVGSYVRVGGLTAGDAAMNGVYQVTAETTPGADWTVVRYDGVTIVAVASTTADVDQHPTDTPDQIFVHTDVVLADTTISFTAPDTIGDSGSGLGIFAVGDKIEVEGTVSNDGIYEVATVVAGTLTTVEQTLVTEAAGGSFTITKIASGLADADFTFSYDFDGNVQGGRTVSTDTFVIGQAIGFNSAQYVESPVSVITSGTPLTIPLFAQTERNTA